MVAAIIVEMAFIGVSGLVTDSDSTLANLLSSERSQPYPSVKYGVKPGDHVPNERRSYDCYDSEDYW